MRNHAGIFRIGSAFGITIPGVVEYRRQKPKKNEIQIFWRIRVENFAFKFNLRHFLEARKVKTLSFFPLRTVFQFFETRKSAGSGTYPLFLRLEFTQII
ncbi:MAG: hypothetical protein A3G87_03140 [Omnitrophica bacterium RIFCSPLOWO2_12_FULL_50_11]|nr:MAG: hypothetical protein A3G87_03140 [Omnitrophica bacterium RIFCSPLOWO2_12_FULL_50_11]